MNNTLVIIPSFRPPDDLPNFCLKLQSRGFQKILVVNDGSPESYAHIFEQIRKNGIEVISERVNRGKGYAIKAGLHHALDTYPEVTYFVFCDDDGQHADFDVAKIALKAVNEKKLFTLGERNFSSNTPWKSLLGNIFTSAVLRLRFRIKAPDSQSGLRCVSREITHILLSIPDERFGFELNALISIHKANIEICTVPIETIYIDGNSRTRFHPINDSIGVIKIALGIKR